MSARSLNKVLLIGNLTRDPELRYTPQGTAVATFGLATNRSWVPSDGGERQEETEYHRVVAWAKLAEICSQLLYKGRKVYVEGRMQTRRFTGQDGNEREITEVVIDNMIALGAPKGNSGQQQYAEDYEYAEYSETQAQPTAATASTTSDDQAPAATAPKKRAPKKQDEADIVDTDDIPF
jgi:single-strand DNA-binding protein